MSEHTVDSIYTELVLLKQKLEILEKAHLQLYKFSHDNLTKSDLLLVEKDINSLTESVKEMNETLKTMKDFPLIRKIIFTGVGVIGMAIVALIGDMLIDFIGKG